MKLLIITALLLLLPACGDAYPKKGDRVTVAEETWVEIKNQEPIANGNVMFWLGRPQSCRIIRGGDLIVVGRRGDQPQLLVRYEVPENQYGSACPSGVIFWMSPQMFVNMPGRYNELRKIQEAEEQLIKQLLKEERDGVAVLPVRPGIPTAPRLKGE